MAEHNFTHDKGSHLRVRFVMEDAVQRMIGRFLTAGVGILIDRQRQ